MERRPRVSLFCCVDRFPCGEFELRNASTTHATAVAATTTQWASAAAREKIEPGAAPVAGQASCPSEILFQIRHQFVFAEAANFVSPEENGRGRNAQPEAIQVKELVLFC